MILMSLQAPSGVQSHARIELPMAGQQQRQTQKHLLQDGKREDQKMRLGENGLGGKKANGAADKPVESTHANPVVETPEARKQQDAPLQPTTKNPPKDSRPKQATTPPQYKNMLQKKEWDVSTKGFPGALHLHFAQEQKDPSFRQLAAAAAASNNNAYWEKAEKDAHAKLKKQSLEIKSCQYYEEGTGLLRVNQECLDGERKPNHGIVAYNSQPFARSWCGSMIEPYGVKHFDKWCDTMEPVRLLLPYPDVPLLANRRDLKKLPPIVFQRTGADSSTSKVENVQDCDVPCKFTMDTCKDANTGEEQKGPACLPELSDWTVDGTDFKFKYSMMDQRDIPEVGISRKGYREHQYYATPSFQSEIPLTTFDWDLYGDMSPKTDFEKSGKRGVCFIHGDPCSGEIRPTAWVDNVQKTFKGPFDNYGPCKVGKTALTKSELDMNKAEDRQSIMGQYMFTLVIGYSQTPDAISQLVWDALAAGSIPVYFGAPNIREHVPPNSIIVGGEHSSKEAMAEYLNTVKGSKEEWEKFHSWRDEEKSKVVLEDKYGFMKGKSSSSYCRMCRWALATKYSLGWDPKKQLIQNPAVEKKFCVSKKDILKSPFEEIWTTDMGKQESKGARDCSKTKAFQQIIFDEVSVDRTIATHDNGIIDMTIADIKSLEETRQVVLRVDFRSTILNVDGANIMQPHQAMLKEENPSGHVPLISSIAIQDGKTRVTILANWVADLRSVAQEGVIDILIKNLQQPSGKKSLGEPDRETGYFPRLLKDEILKIRFIIEDVNLLRDSATEYSVSPFARLMMRDFLDPLMFFQVN